MVERQKVIEAHNGFWTGHILFWGEDVPEAPEVKFRSQAEYNLAYVTALGIPEVGDIFRIKKDEIGLNILVRTDLIPEDYEWSYTVENPRVEHVLDPADGQVKPQLIAYPLTTIRYKRKEAPNSIHSAPLSVVKRTKRDSGVNDDGAASTEHSGTPD